MLINLAELNNDEFITEIVDEFNFQTRGENVRGKKSVVIFNGSPPVQGFNYNINYNTTFFDKFSAYSNATRTFLFSRNICREAWFDYRIDMFYKYSRKCRILLPQF